MKQVIWASSFIVLTLILCFGGVTNQAQAHQQGKNKGLLMDPILIEDGYISGTVFGDPEYPVHIYRGIPYAAPPVGNLRWSLPEPPAPWSGILECVNFSINPVQFAPGRYFPIGDPESEDSLYLNVLTPAEKTNEKLPVMVWFHGGGFMGGAGNQIDWNGQRLPQHGVVLVTVNTRLGALGLLAHPDLAAAGQGEIGNYMFFDMLASLEWVQRNIAAFGGNPDKVTIFGESGGGWKVTALLTSPLAEGLFHRAIIQSGDGLAPADPADSYAWTDAFFAKLGVTTVAEARDKSWQEIVDASVAVEGDGFRAPGFGATLDGYFFEQTPLEAFAAGNHNAVPLIVQGCLGELPGPHGMINYYLPLLEGNLNMGVDSYAAIFNQVPVNWKDAGIVSFHASDLAYTFGLYDDPYANIWVQMAARTGLVDSEGNPVAPELGEADVIVSEDMMTRFARFAKTGNPNTWGKQHCKREKYSFKHPKKCAEYWPVYSYSGDQYIEWNYGTEIKSGFSELP